MSFDNHIKGLCRKANSRLGTLGKVTPYMGLVKKITNEFLYYCPLLWMFHSRSNNNEITHLHERYLGLIYSDNSSSYEELLKRN